MSKPESPSSSKPAGPCLACGGRGVISSGPDDVKCAACDGSGKAK